MQPAPQLGKQQPKPGPQASKEELLFFKEDEWANIVKLCIFMGTPTDNAAAQSYWYRQAREGRFDAHDYRLENNLRSSPLPWFKETAADIESILSTGKPSFASIWDLTPSVEVPRW